MLKKRPPRNEEVPWFCSAVGIRSVARPEVGGILAELLLEATGEVAGRAKAHLVGNLVDRLRGGLQQGAAALQAHLPQQFHRREARQRLHLSI